MDVAVTFENGQNVTNAEGDVSVIYHDVKSVTKNPKKLILHTELGGIEFPSDYASKEAVGI